MYAPSAILHVAHIDAAEAADRCGLEDVDSVVVKPAPRWMVRAWRGPVMAMALPRAIYVRPDRLVDPALGPLLVHELVHIRQWRSLGAMGFLLRYLREYFEGRRRGMNHWQAYQHISLEVEARQIAGC